MDSYIHCSCVHTNLRKHKMKRCWRRSYTSFWVFGCWIPICMSLCFVGCELIDFWFVSHFRRLMSGVVCRNTLNRWYTTSMVSKSNSDLSFIRLLTASLESSFFFLCTSRMLFHARYLFYIRKRSSIPSVFMYYMLMPRNCT